MVAIFVHFHFWKSCTRVGLCSVADGCVRKNVGKRWRLDRAGELEPYDSWGMNVKKKKNIRRRRKRRAMKECTVFLTIRGGGSVNRKEMKCGIRAI